MHKWTELVNSRTYESDALLYGWTPHEMNVVHRSYSHRLSSDELRRRHHEARQPPLRPTKILTSHYDPETTSGQISIHQSHALLRHSTCILQNLFD